MRYPISKRGLTAFILLIIIGAWPGYSLAAARAADLALTQTAVAPGSAFDLSRAIVTVAKDNIPAVVHIEVTQRQEVANPLYPFENDPLFRYFFDTPQMQRKFKRETKGLGTGMIMDAQGNILTNNHVVAGATKIEVLLNSGQKYSAELAGTDPKTDLAVIRIASKEQFPFVTFGDSDKVEVGEWVVAIGHPRGLDQTVTQGIISAKNRKGITDPSSYQDYLQTDAAINPGNSGGPLLNLKGEVIGVNAAIVSESGGFEGIGFAIPSNMALYVAKALIASGKVERGWLGVSVQDLTAEIAKSFGLKTTKGALISDVVQGGPAEKGGLKRGDVLIGFQGKEMPDAGTLRNAVAATPIGQQVNVTIWRDGKKQDLKIKIGNLKEVTRMLTASLKDRLGVIIRAVNPKERERFGLNPLQGVVIRWMDPRGPLGEVGFETGDIILELNGEPIEGLEGFVNMVSAIQPNQKAVLLALDHRTGGTGYVQVTIR